MSNATAATSIPHESLRGMPCNPHEGHCRRKINQLRRPMVKGTPCEPRNEEATPMLWHGVNESLETGLATYRTYKAPSRSGRQRATGRPACHRHTRSRAVNKFRVGMLCPRIRLVIHTQELVQIHGAPICAAFLECVRRHGVPYAVMSAGPRLLRIALAGNVRIVIQALPRFASAFEGLRD